MSAIGSGHSGTGSDAWLERFDGAAMATLNRAIELSHKESAEAVSVEHLATASKAILTAAPHDFDRMAELSQVSAALASGTTFRLEAKTALMDSLRASIKAKRRIGAKDIASATDKAQPY
jgi:4-hydroxy-3-methylbut-2-enyl diphosphate reductase IspH